MKKYYIMLATAITTHLSFGQIILEQGFETNNVLSSNCNSANWCSSFGEITSSISGVSAHNGSFFYEIYPSNSAGQNQSLLSPIFSKGTGTATCSFWYTADTQINSLMPVALLSTNGDTLYTYAVSVEVFVDGTWTYNEFNIPSGFIGDFQIMFGQNYSGSISVFLDDILLVGAEGLNVNELFSKQFKIYNDLGNSSEIKIAYAHDVNDLSISVVNMMGQTVYIKETNAVGGQTETLNTGELQSGIYFVNVESEGLMFTQKIKI